jgi:plastocyanin
MRTVRPLVLGLGVSALLALTLVACGGSEAAWTYAPAPSITPPPSASADASASAAPSGAPGGITLVAQNIAFDTSTIAAPADEAFQIVLDNQDPSVPHDVAIKDASGTEVFKGETFPGVATRTYDVPPLTAGEYEFVCTVHPNMVGTLTAS